MNSNDLKNISNLSKNILSESTTGQESFLDKWPYSAPYLEEKHTPGTKKVKNCGCGKNPCETYGDKAEPVAEGKKEKKLCESCKGEGCDHCNDTGYHMKEENIAEALPLAAVAAGKLMGGMAARGIAAKGAGIAAKGALRKKLVGAVSNKAGEMVQNKVTKSLSDDDDMKEELAPHLKKFDADNKRKFIESGKKAQAERQANIDAFKKHKMEVLAKGGRPVDALDSWMQKKLKKEDYEPAAKLLESGLFTEEEIIKITIG